MKRKYKLMADELEQRRIEIYQMKRESNSQYVMEERENWKAILVQQKQVNSKLERGFLFEREVRCRFGNQQRANKESREPVREE